MMKYKGYLGKVEFDDESNIFYGEVLYTRDVITFQGKSVHELRQAFKDSVDDYLEFCKKRGEKPDKPFSGQFITRIDPSLHREIYRLASMAGKSLNAWVGENLGKAVKVIRNRRNPFSISKKPGKRKVNS